MSFVNFFGGNSLSNAPSSLFLIARVTKVILGPFLEDGITRDIDYNDPTDIGKIRYIVHNSTQQFSDFDKANPLASPAWTSFKHLPIKNEYVYLVSGPSVGLNEDAGAQDYYYLPPFGLWAAANHNAFPSLAELDTLQRVQNEISNQEAVRGVGNGNVATTASISLGNDFVELGNIRSLRPFVGDILIEGRWGNSIRFGSSLQSNTLENNWADAQQDGSPITIIRNGQGTPASKDPWNPTVEDINKDNSSIYLTSGQRIIITDIQNNFSLNSFGVALQNQAGDTTAKSLITIPTSNDYISPQLADELIKESLPENMPTTFSQGGSDTTVEDQIIIPSQSTTPTQAPSTIVKSNITVVGDKYVAGTIAIVTLRAVEDTGAVINSVTSTASTLQTAYVQAVNQLKAKGLPSEVKIPLVNQLTRL